MSAVKPVILCVDDEKTVLNSLRQELEYAFSGQYVFELAESAEEGLEILDDLVGRGYDIPVVISDQLMPGMKGDQFLIRVHELIAETKTILLTGQANAEAVGNAVNRAKLFRYIAKPWDDNDLRLTVEAAAKSFFLNRQLADQVKVLGDLNRAAKALSEEVHSEQVARKFLRTAVTDSQASRGLLYLTGDAGTFLLSGAPTEAAYLDHRWLRRDELHTAWPLSLIDHVLTTGERIVLANAAEVGDWAREADVRRLGIRSLAALPLEGAEGSRGVLYLEATSAIRHFTPERIDFLTLLGAHATICLDNARLYEQLEARVHERTRVIVEKTQQITDSIEYARRIQQAILPPVPQLAEYVSEAVVFYQPKDIVSGDFYWFTEVGGDVVIAAVDCTGHGVPGAFMAVLGNNLLSLVVREGRSTQPDQVLVRLHQAVREALKQYDPSAIIQDGMDLGVIRLRRAQPNHALEQIEYAGARRPLWHVRQGQLAEIKGSRYPVGGSQHGTGALESTAYPLETVAVKRGDMLYLTTDGFSDQFGGPDGRKYSPRRMQELLSALAPLSAAEQTQRLGEHLALWRGSRAQTDDILVLGLRV